MTRRVCVLVAVAVGLGVLAGCGGKPPPVKRVKVTGSVKLDGKDLSTGKITFEAVTGEAPAEFDILDGKFEGLAQIGVNKVQINSYTKKTMKEIAGESKAKIVAKDGPGYDQLVEINQLPDKYNSKSEIKREVVEAGPNKFDFELKSK